MDPVLLQLLAGGFNAGAGAGNVLGAFRLAHSLANPYKSTVNPLQASLNEQKAASDQQTELYNEQAKLAQSEASREANIKAQDVKLFESGQAEGYNNSGVLLQGSPAIVMDRTRRQGLQEVQAINAMGKAQADLLHRQAYVSGSNTLATLLGIQSQFITDQAQRDIQAGTNSQTAIQGGYGAIQRLLGQGIGLLGNRHANAPAATGTLPPDPYDPLASAGYNPGATTGAGKYKPSQPFGPGSFNLGP